MMVPDAASPPTSPWSRFVQRHLHDYNAAATRAWLGLAFVGSIAAIWALRQVAALSLSAELQVGAGLVLVALAALFPANLPRTRYSVNVADLFVFGLLGLHGAPAAALAAGVEGVVGALRASKRLSSWVSTPATAVSAMLLCGSAADALRAALEAAAWSSASADLVVLCSAALLYFPASTLPLLCVVALKNGKRLSLSSWVQNYGWVAAIYLLSAAIAGVLLMNARQYGPSVMVVAVVVTAAALGFVHLTIRRHEADFKLQESRVAEAEHEAELNRQRFTAAFTHAAIGMAIVDHDIKVRQVNQALCVLLGRSTAELQGRSFFELLHAGDAGAFERRVRAMGVGDEDFSTELRCDDGSGQVLWVSLHGGRFVDPADDRSGSIFQLHDITSRRLAENKLHHIAYHDSLTDLANRNCFNERLSEAVERSCVDGEHGFAVMFLDLDRFKMVNDSLGHAAGNQLLREVGSRLSEGVRPGDLVARLGGDEFAVLLDRLQDPEAVLALAQRLQRRLSAPLLINGTEVMPVASIGITFSDHGYRTADEVLRDADLAMYDAKADGSRRVSLFHQGMHQRVAEKLKLEGDLRRAIGEGQLSLVYQPLFSLKPHALFGFEALARWMHPERGAIAPDVFISLAEESGNIEALSAWVIDQAAGQLAEWQAAHPALEHLSMHVNISGRDLTSPALVPHVQDVLQRHGLAPRQLTLEITETTLMGQLDLALDALHALRRLGVHFSIDDFGTGYSSLAYLSTLPIDSLKIDRSFVQHMHERPQDAEIVRAVLTLGLSLGKHIVAEGIETVEQLAMLREMGVHIGQGYLLSRPLPPERVPSLFLVPATDFV